MEALNEQGALYQNAIASSNACSSVFCFPSMAPDHVAKPPPLRGLALLPSEARVVSPLSQAQVQRQLEAAWPFQDNQRARAQPQVRACARTGRLPDRLMSAVGVNSEMPKRIGRRLRKRCPGQLDVSLGIDQDVLRACKLPSMWLKSEA